MLATSPRESTPTRLAEGMVADPDKQREYFHALRAEAARLTHLVENVLAFARLDFDQRAGEGACFVLTLTAAPTPFPKGRGESLNRGAL
ncbi:MAG: hypothetical protein JW809_06760 [Pirellulales bacterium]|nr:hypothetical protein [Pirellulales bacterium]